MFLRFSVFNFLHTDFFLFLPSINFLICTYTSTYLFFFICIILSFLFLSVFLNDFLHLFSLIFSIHLHSLFTLYLSHSIFSAFLYFPFSKSNHSLYTHLPTPFSAQRDPYPTPNISIPSPIALLFAALNFLFSINYFSLLLLPNLTRRLYTPFTFTFVFLTLFPDLPIGNNVSHKDPSSFFSSPYSPFFFF